MAMDDDLLRRLGEQAQESIKRIQDSTIDLDGVTGTAESDDGFVRVRLAADGAVEEVALDPKAMRMASADLAEELTRTLNAARADLAEKLGERGADPLREVQRMASALTDEHGSFSSALSTMQRDLQERLARAQQDIERMRPDVPRRPR